MSVPAATASSVPELSAHRIRSGNAVVEWLTTTDHKTIGTLYLITSFALAQDAADAACLSQRAARLGVPETYVSLASGATVISAPSSAISTPAGYNLSSG